MCFFRQLGLGLNNQTLQLVGVRNVLVSLKLRSDFEGFSSVGIELEGRVESGSERLSEKRRHSFAVSLGEWENRVSHGAGCWR